MKKNLQLSLLCTILCGVQIIELSPPQSSDSQFTLQLTPANLKQQLPETLEFLEIKGIVPLPTEMKLYFPKLFENLKQTLPGQLNYCTSFDIEKNFNQLITKTANGGRSGEYFIFSQDNQFIMKTINEKDLSTFQEILVNYNNHFECYTSSLIVKIFGLFTFQTTKYPPLHMILMRNIFEGLTHSQVIQIYDLKGSTFQREVGHDPKKPSNSLTLKDIDFLKIEQQLHIDQYQQNGLFLRLERDANFFRNHGLIDYSLLVCKIQYSEKDVQQQTLLGGLNKIKCNKEKLIYYHLGIVDYFQKYNLAKWFEKTAKSVLKVNLNLDTSSQSSDYYYQRFINFMARIIFGEIQAVPAQLEIKKYEKMKKRQSCNIENSQLEQIRKEEQDKNKRAKNKEKTVKLKQNNTIYFDKTF